MDDPAFGRVPRAAARRETCVLSSTSRRTTQRQRRYTLEGELVLQTENHYSLQSRVDLLRM
jgi:hypothetical protein